MRGKLSSRPVGDVLREAEKLVKSGVQELLVISQDTSAYGADLKYAKGQWRDREYEARMLGLCEGLSELGAWVRLRSEEHTSELQSLMRISYAVFCLQKKITQK